MKNIFVILFLFLSVSGFSLCINFPEYFQRDGEWHFGYGGSMANRAKFLNADNATFRIIRSSNPNHIMFPYYFAKDKSYVFYRGKRIEGANPRTFELICWWGLYSRDDRSVFFRNEKVVGADRVTFEEITIRGHRIFGRDKNSIYRGAVRMPYDVATFRLLPWGFMVDKSGIYYRDELLKGSSAGDFRQLDNYMISNNRVFFRNREIVGADANTFQILTHKLLNDGGDTPHIVFTIARDKNYIYVNSQRLTKIDAESFAIVDLWSRGGGSTVRDKNGKYRLSHNIENNDWTGTFNLIPIKKE